MTSRIIQLRQQWYYWEAEAFHKPTSSRHCIKDWKNRRKWKNRKLRSYKWLVVGGSVKNPRKSEESFPLPLFWMFRISAKHLCRIANTPDVRSCMMSDNNLLEYRSRLRNVLIRSTTWAPGKAYTDTYVESMYQAASYPDTNCLGSAYLGIRIQCIVCL